VLDRSTAGVLHTADEFANDKGEIQAGWVLRTSTPPTLNTLNLLLLFHASGCRV